MIALVTGGAGFIGSNLVGRLLEEGARVIVVDDFSTGRREHLPRSRRLTVIEADLAEMDGLARLVRRCEVVFHLAAQVGTMPSFRDPGRDARSNVLATVRLLDACRNGAVGRIVCSSSAAVFGDVGAAQIDEDQPARPASFYALGKWAAERYALLAASLIEAPTVSLRYFNVFGLPLGTGENASVIAAFLERLRAGQPLVIHGDGRQSRDFVYVSDVVAANLLASRHGKPGGVYNIGTGTSTTILELAHLVCRLAGREPRLEFRPARPGEILHSQARIDRARAELAFEPAYDLESGLTEMWPAVWPSSPRP